MEQNGVSRIEAEEMIVNLINGGMLQETENKEVLSATFTIRKGTYKQPAYQKWKFCPKCGSDNIRLNVNQWILCDHCNAVISAKEEIDRHRIDIANRGTLCPECNGTGKEIVGRSTSQVFTERCGKCMGKGHIDFKGVPDILAGYEY